MVYLDYAASAPVRAEALEAERVYEASSYAGANPNSLHSAGRAAARALDECRTRIARLVGSRFRPPDVVFTSGGTENNNLALCGMAQGARDRDRKRCRVLVSAIEHDSVLDVAPALRDRGFTVETIAPSRLGTIEAATLERALGGDVALVAVMYANNETGVISPVSELASLAHRAGALFYTDCAQGFCKTRLDLTDVDAAGIVGHKVGAPVGTGALLIRQRTPFRPQVFGGGQERGIRPGTQDVRGALALAAAAEAAARDMVGSERKVAELAERLYGRVCALGTGITASVPTDARVARLPGICSLLVEGVDSESLIMQLDARGFAVSAASACSSGSLDASHVLLAMGIPRNLALGSLRVSFDERASAEEIDGFGEALLEVTDALRRRG